MTGVLTLAALAPKTAPSAEGPPAIVKWKSREEKEEERRS